MDKKTAVESRRKKRPKKETVAKKREALRRDGRNFLPSARARESGRERDISSLSLSRSLPRFLALALSISRSLSRHFSFCSHCANLCDLCGLFSFETRTFSKSHLEPHTGVCGSLCAIFVRIWKR